MRSRRCSRKGFFFERCGVLKLLVIVGTFATISASTEASRHEQEKEKEEAKKLRFSVATLVSGGSTRHDGQDGYTLGAVSLAGSIREASRIRGVDLVAMVTPDVSLSNRASLVRAGWLPQEVFSLEHICFGFSKLNVWWLTEYARVLFADADVLVVKPGPFLALLPSALRLGVGFSAAGDALPSDRLNSGVLVVDPHPTTARALFAAVGFNAPVGTDCSDNNDNEDFEPHLEASKGLPSSPSLALPWGLADALETAERIADGRYRGDQDLIRWAFPQWWGGASLGPSAEHEIEESARSQDPWSWPGLVALGDGGVAAEDAGEQPPVRKWAALFANSTGLEWNARDKRWYPCSLEGGLSAASFVDPEAVRGGSCGASVCPDLGGGSHGRSPKDVLKTISSARLGSRFNTLMTQASPEVGKLLSEATAIHFTGLKPWSLWRVEASGGEEAVKQFALPGWGPAHPLHSHHMQWRRFFLVGNTQAGGDAAATKENS
mmetsp:Transcript_41519/g.76852  ORF Transcript_41519/g.76852 Transcript_41519/m.76852 type:complete len:492 (+) Transcript_41519:87-1562(+)